MFRHDGGDFVVVCGKVCRVVGVVEDCVLTFKY